jgi:hypothetical protein
MDGRKCRIFKDRPLKTLGGLSNRAEDNHRDFPLYYNILLKNHASGFTEPAVIERKATNEPE